VNEDRRREIAALAPDLSQLADQVLRISGLVEQIRDDEQEYLNAMPEGLKSSDRGTAAESAIAALDQVLSDLQSIDTAGVLSSLEEASDRFIDARTLQRSVTKFKPNFDVLPKFAKDHIARLEQQLEESKQAAGRAFGEPTGAIGEIVVSDYIGDLQGRVIPAQRITWPKFEIQAYAEEGYDGVVIRSEGFSAGLSVLPRSGNEIIVRSEQWK